MPNILNLQSARDAWVYFKKLEAKSRVRLGVMTGGGLIFLVFFVWPAWMTRPQIRSQVQGLRGNLTLAESKIKLEPKMREEQKQCDAFIQQSLSRFLTQGESQSLMGVLTELGEKTGVKLLSTQPQTDVPSLPDPFKDKYLPASYLLAVEGGFHSLSTFISDIENYPKILRVEEFSVTPREENPTTLVGEVRLTAFLLKDASRKLDETNIAE